MRIGIVYKKEKVRDASVVTALAEAFRQRGHTAICMHSGAELHDVSYAVVLGGDGALLHAAIIAGQKGIRVVGVNYGTLGFLSEFEAAETGKVVDLICGEHQILSRSVLRVELDGKEAYALNEVSLQRDYTRPYGNQVSDFTLLLNGKSIQKYTADGIAVATPTGSTAYSLSAGGSILAPDVQAFIVTPICSMDLRTRPLIVPDSGVISVRPAPQQVDMRLYADGRPIGQVNDRSRLAVQKAPFTADFVTRDVNRLFQAVNEKLSK